jgi:hypothetical protein
MKLFEYSYNPLLNLFKSDFIDLDNVLDFIPFGEDNLLPRQIVQLSREVAVHRSILNSKAFYIAGKGFASTNKKLSEFIISVNNDYEDLRDVIYKVIFDELNIGNAFFEVVTNNNKNFLQFYHQDASKCRLSADGKQVIIHPDWENYKGKKDKNKIILPIYPNFKREGNICRSIVHIKQYEPEFFYYGLPTWYAGLKSVIISGLTDEWNKNRLENQFNASGLLVIPGVNDSTEAESLQTEFENFSGASSRKSSKLIIQYLKDLAPDQSSQAAQYIEFTQQQDGSWMELYNLSHTHLLSIHNWFKTLCSFYVEKTGFDTNRILNEYEIALNTTISFYQSKYIKLLSRIFKDFNFNPDTLVFLNESPISRLNPVKYIWEIRRDQGLEFDKNDPRQQQFFVELKNTFNAFKDNATQQ